MFFFSKKQFKHGKLLGIVEGPTAEIMAEFIENSPNTYPHCNTYVLKGPNSNTYVQWVLNQFPQLGLTLPWNSFGKGFK